MQIPRVAMLLGYFSDRFSEKIAQTQSEMSSGALQSSKHKLAISFPDRCHQRTSLNELCTNDKLPEFVMKGERELTRVIRM